MCLTIRQLSLNIILFLLLLNVALSQTDTDNSSESYKLDFYEAGKSIPILSKVFSEADFADVINSGKIIRDTIKTTSILSSITSNLQVSGGECQEKFGITVYHDNAVITGEEYWSTPYFPKGSILLHRTLGETENTPEWFSSTINLLGIIDIDGMYRIVLSTKSCSYETPTTIYELHYVFTE